MKLPIPISITALALSLQLCTSSASESCDPTPLSSLQAPDPTIKGQDPILAFLNKGEGTAFCKIARGTPSSGNCAHATVWN